MAETNSTKKYSLLPKDLSDEHNFLLPGEYIEHCVCYICYIDRGGDGVDANRGQSHPPPLLCALCS
jgi:hypothetical protein